MEGKKKGDTPSYMGCWGMSDVGFERGKEVGKGVDVPRGLEETHLEKEREMGI